jgi:hypothetical protein
MSDRVNKLKKVDCKVCGDKMEVDAKSLGGICWKCVAYGKHVDYLKGDIHALDKNEKPVADPSGRTKGDERGDKKAKS